MLCDDDPNLSTTPGLPDIEDIPTELCACDGCVDSLRAIVKAMVGHKGGYFLVMCRPGGDVVVAMKKTNNGNPNFDKWVKLQYTFTKEKAVHFAQTAKPR